MADDLQRLQGLPRQVARWQNAQQQLLSGRPEGALSAYRDLVQRFPGVAQLWFELGMAAMAALDFSQAEQAFHQAEALAPRDVSLLVLIGQQFHRLRRLDDARRCFQGAVVADPSSLHAQLSLAAWHERERRLELAWECVEACLRKHPRNAQALCVRALLLHRGGRNPEAEIVLRDVIRSETSDHNVQYSSRQLLGVVLDQLGQYAEALKHLVEAKALARKLGNTARMEHDYDLADRRRRLLLAELTPEHIRRWRAESPGGSDPPRLAFLGGHPRSGTTLLEQILGAHPDILAFDESEAFVQEIWHVLAPMQASEALKLETLDRLTSARRTEMRERYFKSLFREAPPDAESKVLLDKNPSPTAALHLWLRVFPGLKVVVALRDPRDVIISCFFQNLMLTPTNANFLSLERTVRHYVDLMDVWLRLRELGGFDWIETRYEDLVVNAQAEGSRVTEFLGVVWQREQAQHHHAATDIFVFSPTYAAATQPVHSRAVGRWHHYAEALAPLQAGLAPYCKAFGYGNGS
jgi:tetratricopeptide (TPR) repeat protein